MGSRRRGDLLAAIIGLGGGILIAVMDSRPGFDDTGITAGLLVLVAAIAAVASGRRPWLWALATGIWVPLFEFPWLSASGPFAALLFAGIGAAIGWLIARK